MLSSGCRAHRIEVWGERKTREVNRFLEQGRAEGWLVRGPHEAALRIGYHLDALYMCIETRRIGDRWYPQVVSIKRAWPRIPDIQRGEKLGNRQ